MERYEVVVVAPGIEKAFEQKVKLFAHSPWMAAIQAYMYAMEANVCEPVVKEVCLVKEEKHDATETVLPFSR